MNFSYSQIFFSLYDDLLIECMFICSYRLRLAYTIFKSEDSREKSKSSYSLINGYFRLSKIFANLNSA